LYQGLSGAPVLWAYAIHTTWLNPWIDQTVHKSGTLLVEIKETPPGLGVKIQPRIYRCEKNGNRHIGGGHLKGATRFLGVGIKIMGRN
jgi:hypothetical protein